MSAWTDPSLDLDGRVDALVADLDADESAAVLLGDFTPLTTRGLTALDYVDAGSGLRDVAGATAFPAGIALAATFDAELAKEYGRAVATEARNAGFSVLLGPTLDLARDPRGGRIPEGFGEDPHLVGLIGAAHVTGAQSVSLICQLKHFIAYNGEDRRTGEGLAERSESMDVRASAAVLADAYLRPFQSAIEAGAWSMMGSYNRVNGRYACESAEVLSVPRERWGWRGFYCPDFLFAVRDDAAALAAGLDLPALGGAAGRTRAMVDSTPVANRTALVGNIVRAVIGSGLADDPPPLRQSPDETPRTTAVVAEHAALAERTAIASAVLLANRDAALPFGPQVASIALIGPSGDDALYVVGGSAAVAHDPDRVVTPAAGLLASAAGRTVQVVQGSRGDAPLPTVPFDALSLPDGSWPGVEVEFTDARGTRWNEQLSRVEFAADPADPLGRWPARWRTRLTSRVSGAHRLSLELGGRATVRVDGRVVMVGSREAEQFIHGPHYPLQAVVELRAGEPVDLDIDYQPGPAITIPPMALGPTLRLGWQPPYDLIDEAVAAAAHADAAVVLVTMASGEGMDRDSLALPGDQDELVRRVASVNPRTVVVLNTPGAVLMPWLDQVAAALQVWYPGERYGAALAAMLFGDAEPGGRLPLTFPRSREQLPGGDHGPATVPEQLDYDADGGIGYRSPGLLADGCAFPFGHGFGYAPTSHHLVGVDATDGRLLVRLTVSNEGDRDSTHVTQAYVTVGEDARELAAVLRTPVPAGARVSAVLELSAVAWARWSAEAGARRPVDGEHRLWLGTSSGALGECIVVRVEKGSISTLP